MKYILDFSLLLLLSFSASLAASPRVSLQHLTGSIYLVEDSHYDKTNSIVYIGPTSVTVVGATWSPETALLLAKEIRTVTNKPIHEVVNVDYNPEYAGGNAYWKQIGVDIVSTTLTYALLERDWTEVVDSVRKHHPDYPQLPLVLPTVTHQGDFELQDGRVRAIYLGPSHTADDIFVYFPEERVLYAGSILKEHLGNLAFANLEEYPKTLHKLQELHLTIDTIISGHWSAIHGPELVDQYLKMLNDQAKNAR